MRRMIGSRTLSVLCALVVGSSAPSWAQERETQRSTAVEEGEVRAYAAAKREVKKLAQNWVPKLDSASADDRVGLRQQFAAELLGKVRSAGLSMRRYSEIQAAEQHDAALRSRIDRQGGSER